MILDVLYEDNDKLLVR